MPQNARMAGLVKWAGKFKRFGTVVNHLRGKPGVTNPGGLAHWLKAKAGKA